MTDRTWVMRQLGCVAVLVTLTPLLAQIGAAPAAAADDDARWVLERVETDPDAVEPLPTWQVSAAPGSIEVDITNAPEARFTATYVEPPDELVPGAAYAQSVQVTGALVGSRDVQGYRALEVIILPGGRWNDESVGAFVSCTDPIGAEPISCVESDEQAGELTFSPPTSGDEWVLGFGALNCGPCETNYVYRFEASGGGDGTSSTVSTTSSTLPRHGLCKEVQELLAGGTFDADELAAAGVDLDRAGIIVDGNFLTEDVRRAVRDYNAAHPGREAYVTYEVPYGGTAGALQWLFSEGGVIDAISERYVDGSEVELRDAIVAESASRRRAGRPDRLTPGEVLELAIGLRDGDAVQAMLLAHNTLRSLARNGDVGYTGVARDVDFFHRHLIQLRDADDNAGPWYHLFGTAYFSLVDAGDKGEYLSAGAAAVGWTAVKWGLFSLLGGWPASALRVLTLLFAAGGATHAVLSRGAVTNFLEQAYREGVSGRTPDPEKFCYNIWGFLLGQDLWNELPTRGDRAGSTPFSRFDPPDPRRNSWAPRPGRFFNYTNSPVAVQWELEDGTIVLDQGAARDDVSVTGDGALMLIPVAETDGSWGAIWMGQADEEIAVTFEVTAAGAPATFVRVDAETGMAAVWELDGSSVGDRFTVALDDDELAPELRGPDGAAVTPVVIALDEQPDSGGDDVGSDDAGSDDEADDTLVGGIALVILLGGALWFVRRRWLRRAARP